MTSVRTKAVFLASASALSLVVASGSATAAPAPEQPGASLTTAPAATVATAATTGTTAAAPVAAPPAHLDAATTSTRPVYDYAAAVRESVHVDTRMDTDSDGDTDTVAVDIVRPRELDQSQTRVPVIMVASPYYSCCGRGNESEKKLYDASGVIQNLPLFYDNYFVPRGYAVVGVDILGTNRSTGCGDVGGADEIASVVAVIDWLNGRNTARTGDGTPVQATWTTGAVGMIGKSYDGTLANGVAATGVQGLRTIVPISAISSWYDYTRSGGVPYSPDYLPWLGSYVGHDTAACQAVRADLGEQDADETGDHTGFWAERDYVKDASRIRASVFLTHGLNDYNVQPNHFGQWWAALAANRVPRKLWLALGDHVDPFEFRRSAWVDELHQWFDHWLQGLANDVMREPMATVETAPDVWREYRAWPARTIPLPVGLAEGKLGAPGNGIVTVTDEPALTEDDIVSTPAEEIAGRQMFLSAPLSQAIRISGTPKVSLRIKADAGTTAVTARLIDYGQAARYSGVRRTEVSSCYGESTAFDDSCYDEVEKLSTVTDHGIVGRGWIDAAHSNSVSRPEPLTPGRWTSVTVPLRPQDLVIPQGHVLGLAITLSDTEWTSPNDTGASIEIDLANSRLELPVTSGRVAAPITVQQLQVRITTPTERPDLREPAS